MVKTDVPLTDLPVMLTAVSTDAFYLIREYRNCVYQCTLKWQILELCMSQEMESR